MRYLVPMRITVIVQVQVDATDPDEAVQLATDEMGYVDQLDQCELWGFELHGAPELDTGVSDR